MICDACVSCEPRRIVEAAGSVKAAMMPMMRITAIISSSEKARVLEEEETFMPLAEALDRLPPSGE